MDRKKWLILSCALVLIALLAVVLCVASCEGKEEKLPHIGLCLRQYEADPELGKGLQERLVAAGYAVTVADAKNDQSRQDAQIKEFIEEQSVLLIVEPVIVDAAGDTVSALMEANIPCVFVNYLPEENVLQMWDRISCVYSLEEKTGAMQADIIMKTSDRGDRNQDGQISCLVVAGPEDDRYAVQQAKSCVDMLEESGQTVVLVETLWTDGTAENSRALCNKALAQYGKDVEVIFCGNEAATQGALEALENGGWQVGRDHYLVGAGAEQADHLTGAVACDLEELIAQTVAAAQDLMAGKTVEKTYYVNPKILIPQKEDA